MKILVVILCAFIFCNNCAAIIERTDKPNIRSKIIDSDNDNLYINNDSGKVFKINRSSINDIDHPGNVLMTIGLSFISFSLISLSIMQMESKSSSGKGYKELSLVYGIPGILLFTGGAVPYYLSKNAASKLDSKMPNYDNAILLNNSNEF